MRECGSGMAAARWTGGNWQKEAGMTAGIGWEHGCLPSWSGQGGREKQGIGWKRMT